MKNKFKTSAFWITLTSSIIVIINVISGIFQIDVDIMSIISVASCVIGLLISFGVLSYNKTKINDSDTQNNEQESFNDTVSDIKQEIIDKSKQFEIALDNKKQNINSLGSESDDSTSQNSKNS